MRKKTKVRKQKPALLILDMLNAFDFPEAKKILPYATKAAKKISRIKSHFRKKKLPVIYVNDNFGQWQSDWRRLFETCISEKSLGRDIAVMLKPEDDDYFILKPKHSGFYSTNLEVLLEELNVQKLVITGIAGNICVLFTVNDAHMRDYSIIVPRDGTASNTKHDTAFMLKQLKNVFNIPVPTTRTLLKQNL